MLRIPSLCHSQFPFLQSVSSFTVSFLGFTPHLHRIFRCHSMSSAEGGTALKPAWTLAVRVVQSHSLSFGPFKGRELTSRRPQVRVLHCPPIFNEADSHDPTHVHIAVPGLDLFDWRQQQKQSFEQMAIAYNWNSYNLSGWRAASRTRGGAYGKLEHVSVARSRARDWKILRP